MAQKDEEKKPYVYTKHTYDPFNATKNTAISSANTNATTANKAYTDYINKGFEWDKQNDYNTAYGNYDTWLNTKFNYDFNADALYQQYKDKYIKQGKMAMQDTMGQAAALTGGYGNSYAATVGNQAYQASLQNLNDVIPELYQMAYSMHQDKGQNMLNQLGLLESDRNYKYGVWNDKAGYLNADRSYYQTEADNVFNREYGMWDADRTYDQTEHHNSENMLYQTARDAVADAQWQKNYELNERQVALDENKFHYTTGEYIPKDANGNPIYGGGGEDSGGGGVIDEGGSNPTMGGITDVMLKKAETFTDNHSLAAYVDGLAGSGVITESEADYLYNQYHDPTEKYHMETDKTGNEVESNKANYTEMIKSTKGWKLAYKGGGNLIGIDANARVITPNGEEIRLDKLRDRITDEGKMNKKQADDYIKQLQQALGISSNWFFGL